MHTKDLYIRDPFIYIKDGVYHLYASHKDSAGRRSIVVYTGTDLENWSDPQTVFDPPADFWGTENFFAPEMHPYRGKYYLFCTFKTPERNRATSILRSDSPLGPFLPFGQEQITPMDWMALDGTLYVDENARPWMVFCHEWTQLKDGTMCAVPLKEDLSAPDGPVITLFGASEAPWVRSVQDEGNFVTDGPFLYHAPDGSLNMLWSSFCKTGYCVGRARSEGGISGPWIQDESPVYCLDGGHCMLFTDLQGQLRMSLHGPNRLTFERGIYLKIAISCDGQITILD